MSEEKNAKSPEPGKEKRTFSLFLALALGAGFLVLCSWFLV